MRIGELSRRTGASPRSLRYYEEHGVLEATRSTNGYREYGADTTARVAMIRTLLEVGLPMPIIRDVLVCTAEPAEQPEACSAVFDRMRTVRDRLDDQADRIRAQVATLDDYLALAPTHDTAPPGSTLGAPTAGHPAVPAAG